MQPSAAEVNPSPVNPRSNTLVRSSTVPRSRKSMSMACSHSVASKSLTLEEFSLLPLCGLPAYRAVRTFVLGLEGKGAPESHGRALVLRGHDGAGGVAVQILVRRGWRVCVHVPMLCAAEDERKYMRDVENRVRGWGAEEVLFDDGAEGAVARVIEGLIEAFDAVLDTVGGRDVWEAGDRLLRGGRCGLFTTLVGDKPDRAIPSAGDHFRAGLRSLMPGKRGRRRGVSVEEWKEKDGGKGKVGYAWVSVAQDVDWEGEDVKESLRAVLGMALESGVKPWTGKVVPFEKTPEVFARDGRELLRDGGTVVVRIVG
jgi:NADPH:quinone reductase-like Zn-dependent oxidoreductase